MAGQARHFLRYAPPGNADAANRFRAECQRLYMVLDSRLAGQDFIAGPDLSIADIACWPSVWYHLMHGFALEHMAHVARWFETLGARPAVVRGRRAGLAMLAPEVRPLFDRPCWADPPDRSAEATRIS